MKNLAFVTALAAAALASAPASAVVVASGTGQLDLSDDASDRLVRNGFVSTWASPKFFPGTNSSGHVYDAISGTHASNGVQDIYYRISYTQTYGAQNNLFGGAYTGAYNPTSLSVGYLGDSGASPGVGGTGVFEVVSAAGGSLTLILTSVGGITVPSGYSYTIEAFSDANLGENFAGGAVPEPATWAMLIGGFGLVGAAARRRRATTALQLA